MNVKTMQTGCQAIEIRPGHGGTISEIIRFYESLSTVIRKATSSEECFEFTILGGLARGQPLVELDSIIEFTRFDLRPIARLSCERGGNSK
jgi:hypothetical protein